MAETLTFLQPVAVAAPLLAKGGSYGAATIGFPSNTIRARFTTAQVNAGATLLPALTNGKYRLIDFTIISIGGAASGATSVRIAGTQATSGVQLVTVAVAALTQSTAVKPNSANVTMLADGAGTAVCDINTAITINANGTLATSTAVDFIVDYAIETA